MTEPQRIHRTGGGEIQDLFEELAAGRSSPLRTAFTRRALRAVVGLSRRLAEASLEEAVAAPSDYAALLAALETEPGLTLLSDDDPLAAAKLRGLRAKRELLAKEGGTLSAPEVARLLHLSRQAVNQRRRAGRLLAVDVGRHGFAYPAWQFTSEGILPGLEEVLEVIEEEDPWMKLAFFLNGNLTLDGRTPLEALRQGEIEKVLVCAERLGQQGAR